MGSHNNPADDGDGMSRRDWLRYTGVGAGAALAGCSGDGDGGSEATATETATETEMDGGMTETATETETETQQEWADENQRYDKTGAENVINVEALQNNAFNPTGNNFALTNHQFLYFDESNASYGSSKPYPPGVLEEGSWELDGDSSTWKIKEGYKWWTGEEISIEEIRMQFRIAEALEEPIWSYMDSMEVVDDRTLEITTQREYSPPFWYKQVVNIPGPFTKMDIFSEFDERLQDASTQEETDNVIGDLTSFTVRPNDDGYYDNGTYIWRPSNITDRFVEFEVFEEHVASDRVNWPVRTRYGDPSKQRQLVNEGQIDMADADNMGWATDEDAQGWPDQFEKHPYRRPKFDALQLNNSPDSDSPLSRVPVKKAVAHLLENAEYGNIFFGTRESAVTQATGLNFVAYNTWKDELSDIEFETYHERDVERATSILEGIGWTKDGGEWLNEDGEPITMEFVAPPAPVLRQQAQWASDRMNEFGFNTSVRNIPGSQAWGGVFNGEKLEHMIPAPAGGRGDPTPATIFTEHFTSNRPPIYQVPDEIPVPKPIGDPDGDKEMVNLSELIDPLVAPESQEQIVNSVRELTWAYNQYLPNIPIHHAVTQVWLDRKGWNQPEQTEGGGWPEGFDISGQPWWNSKMHPDISPKFK